MINVNLQCLFDEFKLDLEQKFPTGKIIGLFGASGSGKSRLLRQLLGFDQGSQNTSTISFDGKTWQDKATGDFIPTRERGIGYLPQSVDLFPHLTVLDNIHFSLKYKKEPTNKITTNKINLEKILTQLDINHLITKYPSQLSGGEKQRVGIARAIVASKKLLILDEPFSAIGEDHKPKIMQLLKNINSEIKLTIIYSSHDRFEHAFLTEHLVFLRDGKVLQAGKYQEISTDINSDFAQESDAVNNLKAIAVKFDTDYSLNLLKTKEHSLWAGYEPLNKNSEVNLEIRAKDISVSLRPIENSSMLNCIKTILIDYYEISHQQYLLKLEFEDAFLVAYITKKSFVELGCSNGMELYASFKTVSILSI